MLNALSSLFCITDLMQRKEIMLNILNNVNELMGEVSWLLLIFIGIAFAIAAIPLEVYELKTSSKKEKESSFFSALPAILANFMSSLAFGTVLSPLIEKSEIGDLEFFFWWIFGLIAISLIETVIVGIVIENEET